MRIAFAELPSSNRNMWKGYNSIIEYYWTEFPSLLIFGGSDALASAPTSAPRSSKTVLHHQRV
ncbi:hypothetical protein WP12_10360 [Sphingomonas sp. SRS2]|nr:hypothetical protein WP12_10360 [Sphingomonas sp. SRS2]